MKLYVNERPPALLAVCAPWSGLPVALVDAVSAHADHVGRCGVPGGMALQAAQIQLQGQRTRVQGTSGFVAISAKENRTAPKPIVGARGVPPRGRPV